MASLDGIHADQTTELARMNLDISGKIALVTGADSGIGWETARQLLEEDVRVAISDQTRRARHRRQRGWRDRSDWRFSRCR